MYEHIYVCVYHVIYVYRCISMRGARTFTLIPRRRPHLFLRSLPSWLYPCQYFLPSSFPSLFFFFFFDICIYMYVFVPKEHSSVHANSRAKDYSTAESHNFATLIFMSMKLLFLKIFIIFYLLM